MILNNDSYFEIVSYIVSIGFVSFKIYCKLFVFNMCLSYLCYVNQYIKAMRTIEKNIYKFNELSDEAKEKAISKFMENESYFWGDDAIRSLEGFINHFCGKLNDYEIDWLEPYSNNIRFELSEGKFSGGELRMVIESMGSYDPKTLKGHGDCKFTGYIMDEPLTDGARKAFFNGERDIRELIEAGIKEWQIATQADAEYQYSSANFEELCESNEWEFYVDGSIFG